MAEAAHGETALIIEVPEIEAIVDEIRLRHDPVAARGVPAHITALFPFAPPDDLDETSMEALRTIAAATRPFDYSLVAVDEFPGVVWLRPTPDDAFRDLTHRIVAVFPEHPPYGGRHHESKPHLTLGHAETPAAQQRLHDDALADVAPSLPVACTATALSVFTSNGEHVFERRAVFPFGS